MLNWLRGLDMMVLLGRRREEMKTWQVQFNANGVWVRAQIGTFSSPASALEWVKEQINHPGWVGAEVIRNWRVVVSGHRLFIK